MHRERVSLIWPVDLFRWEAARISRETNDAVFTAAAQLLLEEAVADSTVLDEFNRVCAPAVRDPWDPPTAPGPTPREWFDALLAPESRLEPPGTRQYFAERHGRVHRLSTNISTLSFSFVDVLTDLRERGYFPHAFPRDCPDDPVYISEVASRASAAVGVNFEWDGRPGVDWSDDVLYSLIEYFHDAAKRPRVIDWTHNFGQCGPHYGSYVGESGQAVYRWRMNHVLETHGSDFRIASTGVDRGRLVTTFGAELDELADQRVDSASDPGDEVAHAIHEFRQRGATPVAKRAALTLLAGALEPRRALMRSALTRSDERDLFNIANNWAIRHRNTHQRTDIGDEFLDWMFWNYLAMVALLERVESRSVGS